MTTEKPTLPITRRHRDASNLDSARCLARSLHLAIGISARLYRPRFRSVYRLTYRTDARGQIVNLAGTALAL